MIWNAGQCRAFSFDQNKNNNLVPLSANLESFLKLAKSPQDLPILSIFDKYVTNKEDFLFGDIQMFLDAKAFPWDDCYAPAGVRNYVQVNLSNHWYSPLRRT